MRTRGTELTPPARRIRLHGFHPFPKLPIELRSAICQLALPEPRTITIAVDLDAYSSEQTRNFRDYPNSSWREAKILIEKMPADLPIHPSPCHSRRAEVYPDTIYEMLRRALRILHLSGSLARHDLYWGRMGLQSTQGSPSVNTAVGEPVSTLGARRTRDLQVGYCWGKALSSGLGFMVSLALWVLSRSDALYRCSCQVRLATAIK